MPHSPKNRVFNVLWAACVLLLLGRMYQHLFFEAPYRAFFLKQQCFGWAVDWFANQDWLTYANSLETDRAILSFGWLIGLFFGITILATPVLKSRLSGVAQALLYTSSLLLAFMSLSYYLDKGLQFAQIMEYTAQIATPALLAWYVSRAESAAWQWVLRLAIGLTFLGHGLYALGMYPVPGHFVHMVITNLGISNHEATKLLQFAGWMDVGVAVGVLLPKIDRFWLWYAFVWGLLTALARLTTYVYLDHMFWMSLHHFALEFFIRTPHFLLPLAALMSAGLFTKRIIGENPTNVQADKAQYRSAKPS